MRLKFFLFIFLVCSTFAIGQDKWKEIEKTMARNTIANSNKIGNKTINNQFDLYDKITSRSYAMHPAAIDIASITINGKVDYYNCRFQNVVSFNRVNFKGNFDFTMSQCFRESNFHESIFNGNATFNWAIFKKNAVFSRMTFAKKAGFVRVLFDGDTDFFKAHFYREADFYGTQFGGLLNFTNGNFESNAIFSFANIKSGGSFKNVTFNKNCYFNNSQLDSVDFSGAKFNKFLDLSNCVVNRPLKFTNAKLPRQLDLSNIITTSTIDLSDVKVNEMYPTCYINILNTDLSKIKLRYEDFQLWFPENTSYEAKNMVYTSLLHMLQTNGLDDSYQKLDIEYQQFKYRENGAFITNFIQSKWWNYGYNKESIFNWILLFIVSLTIINTLFLYPLMSTIYEIKFLKMDKVEQHRALHHPILTFFLNLSTGFCYTLILLVGGAFGMGFNSSQIKFPNFIGLVYIISIGLLGISCSAFVINLIFEL